MMVNDYERKEDEIGIDFNNNKLTWRVLCNTYDGREKLQSDSPIESQLGAINCWFLIENQFVSYLAMLPSLFPLRNDKAM